MKTIFNSAITTLFMVCASTGYAEGPNPGGGHDQRLCIPVDGTVSSTPIMCSEIPAAINEALCPQGEFPTGSCLPELTPYSVCFRIAGKGKAKIEGDVSFSRLTTVLAANQFGQFAATPLVFPGDVARAHLIAFTSNASLTGSVVTGRKGTLYTQDTGVITIPEVVGQPQIVGQVLKIVGGTKDFEGASGTIAVAGQEVGGAAFYTGEVCVKAK